MTIKLNILGRCVQGLNLQNNPLICQNVDCPRGYLCSTTDGVCRPQPSHSDIPLNSEQLHADDPQFDSVVAPNGNKCPPNSHYQECGSPCTVLCTEVRPGCKKEEHECIRACVCNDGYVQVTLF